MSLIYIFKCQHGKYYISHSDENKINNEWIERYTPIDILNVIYSDDINYVTRQYMKKYGISNVRGGSYSHMKLSQQQLIQLEIELFHLQIHTNSYTIDTIDTLYSSSDLDTDTTSIYSTDSTNSTDSIDTKK
jgi:hypothetical protein